MCRGKLVEDEALVEQERSLYTTVWRWWRGTSVAAAKRERGESVATTQMAVLSIRS